ncbi:MAG TPA: DSD1 family PLP-dependent enzyme [Candidatus Limnocylindria bacterium]|nr:DSD1 family PLP-dependent enzyme [Candidatus Limnocylindria bacterium]
MVDLDALERNLDRMAAFAIRTTKRVRPHAKTHKSPIVGRMQLDRGAIGLCCAKLGEAEVMADAGLGPLHITTELAGEPKVARLVALRRRAEVMVAVDDMAVARALSDAMRAADLRLDVLVDVNVGQDRTGVSPAGAGELAACVASLDGLRLRGVQAYEGHLQHVYTENERRLKWRQCADLMLEAIDQLKRRGLPVEIVSTAGTGTCAFAAELPEVTEVQAGSYPFMDCDYANVQGLPYEVALTVLASVVSRQRGDTAVIDAGWKALSTDGGLPVVKGRPDLEYAPKGDEHGGVRGARLVPGDRIELVPSHCDTTVNLHDEYVCVRKGVVEAVWPILARGRIQ